MPIQDRLPDLSAAKRLKNYSANDLDLDLFDGYFKSSNKNIESNSKEDDWLLNFSQTSQSMNKLFDESTSDVALCNTKGSGGTRDALYHLFNETAEAIDEAKDLTLNQELEDQLVELKEKAHAIIAQSREENLRDRGVEKGTGKMVSINATTYHGPARQYNSRNC